ATERDLSWLRALYWGEIAYHDAQLAKFIAEHEARGVLADTMIGVTNDHGEELGERGRYGHGHQVFEEMLRAPLIMHYPPLFAPGKVIRDIVEHVDLAPTILDALGKQPLEDADGISLLPLVRGQPTSQPHYAVSEFLHGQRVVRVGTWKLMAKPDSATLYDLAHDRDETKPLGDDAVITRQLCEVHLGEALAVPRKARRMTGIATRRAFRAGEADISPRMRRQLEALGYFGSAPKSGDTKDGDAKDPR
ncbi:MAG: sulfatase, partial [Kofleriaceae bacterium]